RHLAGDLLPLAPVFGVLPPGTPWNPVGRGGRGGRRPGGSGGSSRRQTGGSQRLDQRRCPDRRGRAPPAAPGGAPGVLPQRAPVRVLPPDHPAAGPGQRRTGQRPLRTWRAGSASSQAPPAKPPLLPPPPPALTRLPLP